MNNNNNNKKILNRMRIVKNKPKKKIKQRRGIVINYQEIIDIHLN